QVIEDAINRRIKQPNMEALDETGARTDERVESREFKQLQSRGLEIMDVRIHNILFENTLEDQITQQWSAEWLNIAQKEKSHLEEMESLIETAARNEASKNFARIASRQFGAKPTLPQENPFKTLQLLIQPLMEFILSESAAGNDVDLEVRNLEMAAGQYPQRRQRRSAMKRQMRRDEFDSLIYSLTDKGVEFRNKWRGMLGMTVWLILSGLSMIFMIFGSGAQGRTNIAIVIGMSFVKYIPLLMVV
ncbi:hypothetical protein JZU69_01570, partial [bacterium]|nr:hypothetical protein [bacterium]